MRDRLCRIIVRLFSIQAVMPRAAEIVEIMGFAHHGQTYPSPRSSPRKVHHHFAPTCRCAWVMPKAVIPCPRVSAGGFEKNTIRRVRGRPAAFDIINAQKCRGALVAMDDLFSGRKRNKIKEY